jgi:hypothetical protein
MNDLQRLEALLQDLLNTSDSGMDLLDDFMQDNRGDFIWAIGVIQRMQNELRFQKEVRN